MSAFRRRCVDYSLLILLGLGAAASPRSTGHAAATKRTVLFLCPYGGAKSLIASSYFNRLVEQKGLPYRGLAAAVETPYAAVPPPVAAFLAREGFEVHAFQPRHVVPEDVRGAARIVSIDCNLAGVDLTGAALERWDDVPKVSVDLDASAGAIRRHVEALVAELHERR